MTSSVRRAVFGKTFSKLNTHLVMKYLEEFCIQHHRQGSVWGRKCDSCNGTTEESWNALLAKNVRKTPGKASIGSARAAGSTRATTSIAAAATMGCCAALHLNTMSWPRDSERCAGRRSLQAASLSHPTSSGRGRSEQLKGDGA